MGRYEIIGIVFLFIAISLLLSYITQDRTGESSYFQENSIIEVFNLTPISFINRLILFMVVITLTIMIGFIILIILSKYQTKKLFDKEPETRETTGIRAAPYNVSLSK